MNKITEPFRLDPTPTGYGEYALGVTVDEQGTVFASAMRREADGALTVLLSDSFRPADLWQRREILLLGDGFRQSGPEQISLHPATRSLVARFSRALAEKLAAAEKKYGYSDGWAEPDWLDECRAHLLEHVAKGDPRDVAAYCAFLWHHGASTDGPARRTSTSGWIQVVPPLAPTTLQWEAEADANPGTRPATDIDGADARVDPMLPYFHDWMGLQSLKGDPARRGDLARDAYLSGAAQGALLARTTSVTLRAPQVDKSPVLHGKPVDESANLHGAVADRPEVLRNLQTWLICREIGNALRPELTTVKDWVSALSSVTGEPAPDFLMKASTPAEVEPSVAICIAQLDVWSGRLEAAIDRKAHAELGQHANDDPAAGGRDPMEQYP